MSIISSSSISSGAISSSTISMVTGSGVPQYGSAVVVGLIVLLSLKEVLPETEYGSVSYYNSFDLAILPLFLCLFAISVYKIVSFTSTT